MKVLKIVSIAAVCGILAGCNNSDLTYYTSPAPYETVSVTPPPADNEVRNIIFMIGDGMGRNR